MKKIFSLILFATLLIGCSSVNSTETVVNTGKEASETEGSRLIESEKSESMDPLLVSNGPLLEVGQYKNDDYYGKIILEKIADQGNQIEVADGFFVTVNDVKILKFEGIPKSSQQDANIYYGFQGNQGYDLQVTYSIENKNDFEISNTIIDKIILSDGEQISKDAYTDEEEFYLEATSKASNQITHISIPHAEVDSVKFYFEPVNTDSYAPLESQPLDVMFN